MNFLVVDDHQIFVHGLQILLENNFENANILTANNATNALAAIEQSPNIDLLILDIGLPEVDGCAFLTLLNERNYTIPTCIISVTEDVSKIHNVMSLGAMGFIPKEWDAKQIVAGLKQILQGQIIVPEEVQKKLNTFNDLQKQILLSKRQRDVLLLLRDGLSNLKISQILNITEYTVKSHVSALLQLFDAGTRMQCVENAKKLGIM
ncbi:MAG: response regulator transcription factor [Pseudomonadota bacterium]